jgi:hypothetical protein
VRQNRCSGTIELHETLGRIPDIHRLPRRINPLTNASIDFRLNYKTNRTEAMLARFWEKEQPPAVRIVSPCGW